METACISVSSSFMSLKIISVFLSGHTLIQFHPPIFIHSLSTGKTWYRCIIHPSNIGNNGILEPEWIQTHFQNFVPPVCIVSLSLCCKNILQPPSRTVALLHEVVDLDAFATVDDVHRCFLWRSREELYTYYASTAENLFWGDWRSKPTNEPIWSRYTEKTMRCEVTMACL